MPGHIIHNFVDRQMFGKSYYKLHRKMDFPVFWLGRTHRVLFHDWPTSAGIANWLYPGDKNALWSAWLHITLDSMCSNDRFFKKRLEVLAYADRRRRKLARSRNKHKGKRRHRAKVKEDVFFENLARSVGFF